MLPKATPSTWPERSRSVTAWPRTKRKRPSTNTSARSDSVSLPGKQTRPQSRPLLLNAKRARVMIRTDHWLQTCAVVCLPLRVSSSRRNQHLQVGTTPIRMTPICAKEIRLAPNSNCTSPAGHEMSGAPLVWALHRGGAICRNSFHLCQRCPRSRPCRLLRTRASLPSG